MAEVGKKQLLTAKRFAPEGVYLADADQEILLPRKQVPTGLRNDDEVMVFVYHDGDSVLMATTMEPKGVLGDILALEVVNVTKSGAYLQLGIPKDVFMHSSQIRGIAEPGETRVVKLILDYDGRLSATEMIESTLDNSELTVEEKQEVQLIVLRETDLGYNVAVDNKHLGLLHFSDVFRHVKPGDSFRGHIKKILAENKLDIAEGKHGYQRVEDELGKIMRLLEENEGFLPFHDKSEAEDIYAYFGMSKKTFKKAVGALYKQRLITLSDKGISKV
jgi:uncharacterized protein